MRGGSPSLQDACTFVAFLGFRAILARDQGLSLCIPFLETPAYQNGRYAFGNARDAGAALFSLAKVQQIPALTPGGECGKGLLQARRLCEGL